MIDAENAEEQRTRLNKISGDIIAAAVRVHIQLGPGLLENAYLACLEHELRIIGFEVRTQVYLPVEYKGVKVKLGYRMDMLVEDSVVVELKTTDGIDPLSRAQLLSYLRLSGKKLGLLINFHSYKLTDGLVRVVNGF